MSGMGRRDGHGRAGDADYDAIGPGYTDYRQPEPRIEALILEALGGARSVLNVGAGAGSYEPRDREVVAVEPSASMRAQRPPDFPRAVDASAECLPFPDGRFDAAMATFTVHQWRNLKAGLREMRRVTKGAIVVLSCDPTLVERFWLADYAPAVLSTEARRYPTFDSIGAALGGAFRVEPVPIPLDCRDGFNEAYYGRPEILLEDGARRACSAWSFVETATAEGYVENLRRSLETGEWDQRYGHLREQTEYDGSLRLLVALP